MNDIKQRILETLGQKDYVPANVPELLQLLRLPAARQQELQAGLRELEQAGQIARLKGNRYMLSVEADLIAGRIRMNRSGKGFLQPDDTSLKEIAIAENATGTALHEDRVLVRRDVRAKGLRPDTAQLERLIQAQIQQPLQSIQPPSGELHRSWQTHSNLRQRIAEHV